MGSAAAMVDHTCGLQVCVLGWFGAFSMPIPAYGIGRTRTSFREVFGLREVQGAFDAPALIGNFVL